MSNRRPKTPIYLLTAKRLRREHGLSWHRIRRAVDQERITPFAVNGDSPNDAIYFHPAQLEVLIDTCKGRPKRRWETASTSHEVAAGEALPDRRLSPPSAAAPDSVD